MTTISVTIDRETRDRIVGEVFGDNRGNTDRGWGFKHRSSAAVRSDADDLTMFARVLDALGWEDNGDRDSYTFDVDERFRNWMVSMVDYYEQEANPFSDDRTEFDAECEPGRVALLVALKRTLDLSEPPTPFDRPRMATVLLDKGMRDELAEGLRFWITGVADDMQHREDDGRKLRESADAMREMFPLMEQLGWDTEAPDGSGFVFRAPAQWMLDRADRLEAFLRDGEEGHEGLPPLIAALREAAGETMHADPDQTEPEPAPQEHPIEVARKALRAAATVEDSGWAQVAAPHRRITSFAPTGREPQIPRRRGSRPATDRLRRNEFADRRRQMVGGQGCRDGGGERADRACEDGRQSRLIGYPR